MHPAISASDEIPVLAEVIAPGKIQAAIDAPGEHTVALLRENGRVIKSHTGRGKATYLFGNGIGKGTYVLRVTADGKVTVKRIAVR
jgi:hypothetical protein